MFVYLVDRRSQQLSSLATKQCRVIYFIIMHSDKQQQQGIPALFPFEYNVVAIPSIRPLISLSLVINIIRIQNRTNSFLLYGTCRNHGATSGTPTHAHKRIPSPSIFLNGQIDSTLHDPILKSISGLPLFLVEALSEVHLAPINSKGNKRRIQNRDCCYRSQSWLFTSFCRPPCSRPVELLHRGRALRRRRSEGKGQAGWLPRLLG